MLLLKNCRRTYSQNGTNHSVKKSIFMSESTDIYTNLALEDWLYRYFDFTNHHILMLWRSAPCVVIGKFQNPWLEANVESLPNIAKAGVKLARRNSGGGTVYHDTGNLNLSFLCPKERYNRKYNLEIITSAIRKLYNLDVRISPREDLTLDGFKVSGTAAKLGRPNSYHHCTLLVNSVKGDISEALKKCHQDVEITTHATRSMSSPVKNLCDSRRDISIDDLSKAIAAEYLRTAVFRSTETDGRQIDTLNENNEFAAVNPCDEHRFPGVTALREQLSAWDWCYGRTPPFCACTSLQGGLKLCANVDKGLVTDIKVSIPETFTDSVVGCCSAGDVPLVTGFEGVAYSADFLRKLERLIVSPHFRPRVGDEHIVNILRTCIASKRYDTKTGSFA